jgi:redox-sensitive bicupin YhaK (pirin superfamily)
MKKIIETIYGGVNANVGDLLVNRLLPGEGFKAVGPIVFLDHVYPVAIRDDSAAIPTGEFAHPHRGIATFSYVFNGRLSHYDSQGNHDIIGAGGVQWMKAGNGIIHDEKPFTDQPNGDIFHSMQFWINLPSKHKSEQPEYMAVQAADIPEVSLPEHAGTLRVLLGTFGAATSPVKTFSQQFIYHIKLHPKSSFTLRGKEGLEYAAFVPSSEVLINGSLAGNSKIIIFGKLGDDIFFENPHIKSVDILLFGGAPYTEEIVSQGPFVMNSHTEIATAYREFFEGKYGTIAYTNSKH